MRRRTEIWPPASQNRRILSSGRATRTGERFWILRIAFYRQGCLQFVAVLSRLSVTRDASHAAVRRKSPNGEPFAVSPALPGHSGEEGVLFCTGSKDSSSRRPSVSYVSAADAVGRAFCEV